MLETTKSETSERDEDLDVEPCPDRQEIWYHFLAKGWECPGHDKDYKSSSCIGAVYVG